MFFPYTRFHLYTKQGKFVWWGFLAHQYKFCLKIFSCSILAPPPPPQFSPGPRPILGDPGYKSKLINWARKICSKIQRGPVFPPTPPNQFAIIRSRNLFFCCFKGKHWFSGLSFSRWIPMSQNHGAKHCMTLQGNRCCPPFGRVEIISICNIP